jgi:hypothetical protein
MFEDFRSFAEYVLDYELQRSEGLLLRHLNSVYKVLSQTVPDGVKTAEVGEMELYLRTLLRQVDSSLEDEWERMRDPGYRPFAPAARRGDELRSAGAETTPPDITRDAKAFTAAIRTRIFTFLRAWTIGHHVAALDALDDPPAETDADAWTQERLRSALEDYRVDHERVRLDPEARNLRHTHVDPSDDQRTWRVQQVLVDPALHNDWMAEWEVNLAASREATQPVLWLRRLGPIG